MEKIVKHTSIIYAILIFLGYTYLHVYYYAFGIEIFSYLEIGELLLSFLKLADNIIIFILLILISYGPQFYFSTFNVVKADKAIDYIERPENKKVGGVVKIVIGTIIIVGLIWLCYEGVVSILEKKEHLFTRLIAIGVLLIGVCISVYYLMIWTYRRHFGIPMPLKFKKNYNVVMAILFAFTITGYIANSSSLMTRFNVNHYKVEFEYEGRTIKTDGNIRYVGMTSKYLFLWKFCEKENYIFERERLSNLKIKPQRH